MRPGLAGCANAGSWPQGQARRLGEFAGPARPLLRKVHDPPAARIGESGEVRSSFAAAVKPSRPIFRPLASPASSRDTRRTVWPKLLTWPSGRGRLHRPIAVELIGGLADDHGAGRPRPLAMGVDAVLRWTWID